MQHDDIKLTSGAVLLAAILLAATDSHADNTPVKHQSEHSLQHEKPQLAEGANPVQNTLPSTGAP